MSETHPDIQPLELDSLSWLPDDQADSIRKLADAARGEADQAIRWYARAKKPKKLGATWLRALTIISTTAAIILTVLAQWFDGVPDGEFRISPLSISLALALSAALLGIDHFFGFSRAWIRYVSADLQIRIALNEFNLNWPLRMTQWEGGKPDANQTKEAITVCSALVVDVAAIVKTETEQWIVDFQTSLKGLTDATKAAEKSRDGLVDAEKKRQGVAAAAVKAAEDVSKPGALNIAVTNGDKCEGGWQLAVGEKKSQGLGKTAGVVDLAPGVAVVRVKGKISGNPVAAEMVADVKPGTVANCSLTLA